MDAKNFNGHSMCQPLPYDEIEMWHGHPDLNMKKLDEILDTPDDSDIGYSVEVDLRHPDDIKEKKISHLLLKLKLFLKVYMMRM